MKISKKSAIMMLDGWEKILVHNEISIRKISKTEYINAYFETLMEDKVFCISCLICDKCSK